MMLRRNVGRAASEVDIDATFIFLRLILETEFATDSLDARLDFLDVVGGMVPFADDSRQRQSVRLPSDQGVSLTRGDGSDHAPLRT